MTRHFFLCPCVYTFEAKLQTQTSMLAHFRRQTGQAAAGTVVAPVTSNAHNLKGMPGISVVPAKTGTKSPGVKADQWGYVAKSSRGVPVTDNSGGLTGFPGQSVAKVTAPSHDHSLETMHATNVREGDPHSIIRVLKAGPQREADYRARVQKRAEDEAIQKAIRDRLREAYGKAKVKALSDKGDWRGLGHLVSSDPELKKLVGVPTAALIAASFGGVKLKPIPVPGQLSAPKAQPEFDTDSDLSDSEEEKSDAPTGQRPLSNFNSRLFEVYVQQNKTNTNPKFLVSEESLDALLLALRIPMLDVRDRYKDRNGDTGYREKMRFLVDESDEFADLMFNQKLNTKAVEDLAQRLSTVVSQPVGDDGDAGPPVTNEEKKEEDTPEIQGPVVLTSGEQAALKKYVKSSNRENPLFLDNDNIMSALGLYNLTEGDVKRVYNKKNKESKLKMLMGKSQKFRRLVANKELNEDTLLEFINDFSQSGNGRRMRGSGAKAHRTPESPRRRRNKLAERKTSRSAGPRSVAFGTNKRAPGRRLKDLI